MKKFVAANLGLEFTRFEVYISVSLFFSIRYGSNILVEPCHQNFSIYVNKSVQNVDEVTHRFRSKTKYIFVFVNTL